MNERVSKERKGRGRRRSGGGAEENRSMVSPCPFIVFFSVQNRVGRLGGNKATQGSPWRKLHPSHHCDERRNREELPWPPMAAPVPVDFARSSWYQRVRTAETNSAVVEAHGSDAAVWKTRPAKFVAKVEKR